MNYLGIDFGKKRIGLAISASGVLARGYCTLAFSNYKDVISEILTICTKEKIERIIIGLPQLKSGSDSSQTTKTREFKDLLQEKTDLPIIFVDEYLSSHEATEMLKATDPKIAKDKNKMLEKIDQVAAQVILEQYLNDHK